METNLSNTGTIEGTAQEIPEVLANIAKAMADLDDLVRLLGKGLSRAKPWQRQLASQLSELDRLLQVLRMTIVLERTDSEILAGAEALRIACRKTSAATGVSRCDRDTKAAILLIADLANGVREELRRLDSTRVRLLPQALSGIWNSSTPTIS